VLVGQGCAAVIQGDTVSARTFLQQALELAEARGLPLLLSGPVHALGHLERAQGCLRAAEAHYRRALNIRWATNEAHAVVECLESLAAVAAESGDGKRAARLWAAGEMERERRGYGQPPVRQRDPDAVAAVRAVLGDEQFGAAWNEGLRLTLEEAVGYASTRGRERAPRPATGWESLTPAEREVAMLVAEGLTNSQISEGRFISLNTVKKHVARSFAKLDVTTRTALANQVRLHGHDGRTLASPVVD